MTPHGSYSTYTNHKCRCTECRRANADQFRRRQAEQRQELASGSVVVPHGRQSTYVNWGCRCEDCTAAASVARRNFKRAAS